ncbi:MAG: hypothetical protein ACK5Y2_02810 [Bdellovibrionales bacterium]
MHVVTSARFALFTRALFFALSPVTFVDRENQSNDLQTLIDQRCPGKTAAQGAAR